MDNDKGRNNDGSEMSDEDWQKTMDDFYSQMAIEDAKTARQQERFLKALAKVMGEEFVKDLKGYMKFCGDTHNLSVVRKTTGRPQEEDEFGMIKNVYVHQYCNGGYSGDDFAGYMYIPITKNRFIRFNYSC